MFNPLNKNVQFASKIENPIQKKKNEEVKSFLLYKLLFRRIYNNTFVYNYLHL